ncbi:MAG: S8 family serine peptidase [Candidatus Nitrosocosmicus sp.]|nr:S8 family serine peptidase [Candidatus Nitrosocosmicus sp.]
MTMGFLSSISTPISYAQSGGIPDLPFLDFNSDNNNKENDNLKELYDMIPGLNTKDNNNIDSKTGNKDAPEKTLNEESIDSKNNDESKISDYAVYSDDVKEGIDNTGSGNEKDKGTTATTPSILTSILDKLPYSDSLSPSSSSTSSPPSSSVSQMGQVIPNQYIVVLNDDALNLRDILSEVAKKVNIEGTEILQVYEDVLNGFAISVPNERVIEVLERSPFVDYIEKDKTVKAFAQTLPSGVNRVDGDLSSTKSGNGGGAINTDIAILDSGIYASHSDLNIHHQKTFVSGTSSGNDDNGHGTHVAGIAAAKDNSIGGVGVAPGAKLWAIKVLDRNGSGALSTIIKGIDYIRQYASQIEVANLSLGCECKSSAFDTAINNAVKAGITFVVASGNSGKDASTFSPANNPNVIAVSAIGDSDGKCGGTGPSTGFGRDDTLASFSNYGAVVDVAAPGTKIYSTYKGNSYATMSGTSMASPHVAGAAALYEASHPGASPSEVRNALLSNGSTSSTCDGKGRGYFTSDKDSYREPLLYVRNY